MACGLASFFTIPKSPSEARFLSPEQRAYAVQRLQDDAAHAREVTIDGQVHHLVVDDEFSWKAVWSVFADPQTYFLAVIGFCSGTNVYSVAYFLPTVLAGFTSIATTTVITQLLTVPYVPLSFFILSLMYFVPVIRNSTANRELSPAGRTPSVSSRR